LKMGLQKDERASGVLTSPTSITEPKRTPGAALALVTLLPLIWLLTVTMTAGWQKIFHEDSRIGFLAQVKVLKEKLPALETAFAAAKTTGAPKAIEEATKNFRTNLVLQFNYRLDAVVTAVFLALVAAVALLSFREWILLLARRKLAVLRETEPTWLPDYAIAESRPMHVASLLALGLALIKELSGQSHLERAQSNACQHQKPTQVYCDATEQRFNGIRRCC
jgi:hypothetical protein